MKRYLTAIPALTIALLLAACGASETSETSATETSASTSTETAVAESHETYPITGTIVARDEAKNEIRTDHDEIPGFMKAMEMSYEVRGTKVADLPAVGSRFKATLHVSDEGYWLTDIQPESAQ